MGISISKYSELTNNELLKKFCSNESISPLDPFWNQLLAFNITPPSSSNEQLYFDSSTENLLQSFLVHNLQSGNLGSLVEVFIARAAELLAATSTDNVKLSWQTYNALFVICAVTKYLVEMVPESVLRQHFDPINGNTVIDGSGDVLEAKQVDINSGPQTPEKKNGNTKLEMLCDALLSLICNVPVTDNTYYLHVECINTLLVLMSVYMFANVHGQARQTETSFVYSIFFQGRYSILAPILVKSLLNNYSQMHQAPENIYKYDNESDSVVINIASGLWNILTFNSGTTKPKSLLSHPAQTKTELVSRLTSEHPLANASCLLLLCLATYSMNDDNLYRVAMLNAQDTADTTITSTTEGNASSKLTAPKLDMALLHRAICATASCEHVTLLIYSMLHSCVAYKKHVYNDPHIENMIIPILQCLYNAPDNSSHHIYMSLIILLILTEEDSFNKAVHQVTIKNPIWYTERSISDITLGGLCILVIIRTVQYNIIRVRDKYLHTNCLAALANMSNEFRNVHPYVAQRLVSLFETLSKRRSRLCHEINLDENEIVSLDLVHPGSEKSEELEHIYVLDEVLRMLLEILNSCLSSQLANNLNLVYALLHKKSIFDQYKSQPRHAPTLNNIEMVIGFFSSRLQRYQENAGTDLGVHEVLQCIKKGAEQWSNDRLKKFPDLKFRYVEEDRPEEFFSPYVWALISSSSNIYWASECSSKAMQDLVNC